MKTCLQKQLSPTKLIPTISLALILSNSAFALSWNSPLLQRITGIRPLESQPVIQMKENKSMPSVSYSGQKFSLVSWTVEPDFLPEPGTIGSSLKRYDFVMIQGANQNLLNRPFLNSINNILAGSYLYRDSKVINSIHSRYAPDKSKTIVSKSKAPFLNISHTSLFAHFGKLLLINVNTHRYISFEEWRSEIDLIFLTASSQSAYIVVAGDFSVTDEERRKYLLSIAQKKGLQKVEFREDQSLSHSDFIHNYIFAKGLRLRSAEIFPIGQSSHRAAEVVLEPSLSLN